MTKKIAGGIICFGIALLFCGCAQKKEGKTVLRVALWSSGIEMSINQRIFDDFAKNNPDIKLKIEYIPNENYRDKIITSLAGAVGPDVFLLFVSDLPVFYENKTILPLNDFIANSRDFKLEDFLTKAIEPFRYEGKVYAIPRDLLPLSILYYNKSLFDKNKLVYPDTNWTISNLTETAKKLTTRKKNRVECYGFVPETPEILFLIFGGSPVDDRRNPKKSTVATDARFKKGVQLYSDMVIKYRVCPSPFQLKESGKALELFQGGRCAMFAGGVYNFTFIKHQKGLDWGFTLFPKSPDGIRAWPMGSGAYCVNAKTQQKEAAWRFIKYVTGTEAQTIMSQVDYLMPSRTEVLKKKYTDSLDKTYGDRKLMAVSIENCVPPVFTSKSNQIEYIFNQEIEKHLLGQQNLDMSLNDAAQKIDKILSEN